MGIPQPKKIGSKTQKRKDFNKQLREQYGLGSITASRWGDTKTLSRLGTLKGFLWTVFSQYIRARDTKNGMGYCIACGAFTGPLQAGHYVPVGGNDLSLCFDEQNVNGECEKCNGFDDFHLVPMRKNLIIKYGIRAVEDLERRKDQKRAIVWDEADYVRRIKYYQTLLNTMQKCQGKDSQ